MSDARVDVAALADVPDGGTLRIDLDGTPVCLVNTGGTDLVTLIWANEPFNPDRPDTYYLEV